MFDNDCPRLIIIHIMAQTTVTTSPLVLSVLSLSQILTLLYAAVFSVRLSFPLICSRPSACSSDVSHPLQQSINPLKWECKSVISEFTLTTHETVDIAQIGFSKKTLLIPGLSVRQPVLILFASSLTRYELCHLRMTHQTAALFVTLCVRPCVCLPERQYSKQYEKTKAGVNMPSIRGWPGRLLGWRTVNTQGGHNTTQHLIWKWFTLALQ